MTVWTISERLLINMNKFIDPKNPNTVGKSVLNLGNHILVVCFVMAIVFVVKVSYS